MTPEEQEQIVGELEIALDRLQSLYNQYFMGIEKLEPMVQRKDVERKINMLRKQQLRNTAVRFRLQTQIQKYNTQNNYWKRICRQIEEGTYKRDVMRAKRRTKVRDEHEVASSALSKLDDETPSVDPPTYDLTRAGLDLDDAFDEGPTAVAPRSSAIDDLDDPFAEPKPMTSVQPSVPTGPTVEAPVPDASFTGDPDKTPVPIAGSGVHNLRERLIEDTKHGTEKDAGKLAEFFTRRSVPPPPPSAKPAPPKPRVAKTSPRKAKAAAKQPRPKAQRPAARADGVNDDRMKAVYRAYVSARKKCNENANVSFDKVSNLLHTQLKSNANIKDFKVVIRKGKAVIKTVKK